jgi:hypothetical protein
MPTYRSDNGDWSVVSPSSKISCYYYQVTHRGEPRRAYLTYRLTGEGAPVRDLLMVQRDDQARLPAFLDQRDRSRLELLEREIIRHRSSRGALTTTKELVNQIYRNEAPFENLVVAVHRLGPVPIYLLPTTVEIEVNDQVPPRRVNAAIGVYQDVSAVGNTNWPANFFDRREFLESLERDLPTIFRRYFEDACEDLFDIQHHLSYDEVISQCAMVRETIGVSIGTKVRDIVEPYRYQAVQPEAAEIAMRLAKDYADIVLLAESFSAFVLLLVNELYRMFCLKDDCERYEQKLAELRSSSSLGPETSSLPDLDALNRIIDLWRSGDPALDSLDIDTTLPHWLDRLASFARFIRVLKNENFSATRVRLFFSSQHNVPSPETVGTLVREQLDSLSPVPNNPVLFLEVYEDQPGIEFLPLITNRIWQSESLTAVIPSKPQELGGLKKDISWIVREIDYADALNKRVVLMLEQGVDLKEVIEEAKAVHTPLATGTRRRAKRPSPVDTFMHYTGGIIHRYRQESMRKLDANIEAFLRDELRTVVDRRTETLLRSIINFVAYDQEERVALREIHRRTSDRPLKVEELAPFAFRGAPGKKARSKFEHLRERIRDRTVKIEDEGLEVVAIVSGTRKYKTNFPLIVSRLRPDLGTREVEKIIARAFGVGSADAPTPRISRVELPAKA